MRKKRKKGSERQDGLSPKFRFSLSSDQLLPSYNLNAQVFIKRNVPLISVHAFMSLFRSICLYCTMLHNPIIFEPESSPRLLLEREELLELLPFYLPFDLFV